MKFEDCQYCIHYRGDEDQETSEDCAECEVGENFEEDDELDLNNKLRDAA